MTGEFYDKDGKPITMEQWGKLRTNKSYSRIARDEIGKEVTVSTVWLGMDHSWRDDYILIFETKVFGGERDSQQRRYSTVDEALKGHAEIVALVKGEANGD